MQRDYRTVGFEWDAGNRAKCRKHGITVDEIESLFRAGPVTVPDPTRMKSG